MWWISIGGFWTGMWYTIFKRLLSVVLVTDWGVGGSGGRRPTRRPPQKTRWGVWVDLGGEEWLNHECILKVDQIGCACELDVGRFLRFVYSLWPTPALWSVDLQLVAVTLGTVKRYKQQCILLLCLVTSSSWAIWSLHCWGVSSPDRCNFDAVFSVKCCYLLYVGSWD